MYSEWRNDGENVGKPKRYPFLARECYGVQSKVPEEPPATADCDCALERSSEAAPMRSNEGLADVRSGANIDCHPDQVCAVKGDRCHCAKRATDLIHTQWESDETEWNGLFQREATSSWVARARKGIDSGPNPQL